MLIGKIIGTIVATQKDEELEGFKLLLVQQITPFGKKQNTFVVCVDSIGAGVGELIIYTTGSSARQTQLTKEKPIDHIIIGIIDEITLQDLVVFNKKGGFVAN
jgi:microcompartment protein CcmK/EutM